MSPIVLDNATTLLLVLQENTFHFTVDLSVINESVGFEIVFEAAEVEVGRADAAKIVVDKHHLAVEHPCVIEIYLYAGGKALRYVAV